MTYEKKVAFAIKLFRSIPTDDGPIEISYSGGKDSDVILELAKMAGIPYEAIYKQTTIDPPGTTAHAKEMGATIIRPEKSFLALVGEYGLPTRHYRYCCAKLKEYKVRDRAVHGIRRCESRNRSERYKEPEVCRAYPGGENVRVYLPILEWGDDDVARFVKERGIKCHPLYYDDTGKFHPERRLGCICCPLACRRIMKEQYKLYPKFLRAEAVALKKFHENKPDSSSARKFKTPWDQLFFHIFCDNMEQYETLIGGVYSLIIN